MYNWAAIWGIVWPRATSSRSRALSLPNPDGGRDCCGPVGAPAPARHPVADLSQERIQRLPVLGGLISEYERAA